MNEKRYDDLMNEGGEGYNPIRNKIQQPVKMVRSCDTIIREMNAMDMGDPRNEKRMADLEAELKANYPEDYEEICGD